MDESLYPIEETGEPLTGIILAGGEGRRMGVPKAFLMLDGRPALEFIIERIEPVCPEVLVVVSPALLELMERKESLPSELHNGINHFERVVSEKKLQLHIDPLPGKGPMGGMAAGLRNARFPWSLVTGCDAPLISSRLTRQMFQYKSEADVIVPEYQDRLQPLQALYRKEVGEVVWERVRTNRLKVMDLLIDTSLRVHTVREVEWAGWGVPESTFTNLNRPEDLQTFSDFIVR